MAAVSAGSRGAPRGAFGTHSGAGGSGSGGGGEDPPWASGPDKKLDGLMPPAQPAKRVRMVGPTNKVPSTEVDEESWWRGGVVIPVGVLVEQVRVPNKNAEDTDGNPKRTQTPAAELHAFELAWDFHQCPLRLCLARGPAGAGSD